MLTDNLVARIRSPTPVVFKQVTPPIPLGHGSEHFTGIFLMASSRKYVSNFKLSAIVDELYTTFWKGDAVSQQEGHGEQIRPWGWSSASRTAEDWVRDSQKDITFQ